jgi:hypothetical protein
MLPWTIHDIRRTVATNLIESRQRVTKMERGLELRESYSFAKPHIVEAILNHISGHKGGVAGVYIGAPRSKLPEFIGKRRRADRRERDREGEAR